MSVQDEDLPCTVHVRGTGSCSEFADTLARLLGVGPPVQDHLETPELRIYVDAPTANPKYAKNKSMLEDPTFGLLYWPFQLEIDPRPPVSKEQYVAAVRQLVAMLRERGYEARVSFDWGIE